MNGRAWSAVRVGRLIAALAVATASWAGATAAGAAESVWVANANGAGQGYVITLGRRCYAITAGHVIAGAPGATTVTEAEGFQATANVVAVDERLDLGLLRIDDTADRTRKVCARSVRPTMLDAARLRTAVVERAPVVWIDRIDSAAGILDRFDLGWLAQDTGGDRLRLAPANGAKARLPGAGDSGATVWIATDARAARLRRYDAEGRPARRFGTGYHLLGVYVGGGARHAEVVPGARVREFVLQALRPVAWNELTVEPASARLTQAARGALPDARRPAPLELDDAAFDRLAFEIDLGPGDTVIESVALEGRGPLTEGGRPRVQALLRASTSIFPPGPQAAWTAEACVPRSDRPRAIDAGQRWRSGCELRTRRVSRGLRLQVSGIADGLERIVIRTARP